MEAIKNLEKQLEEAIELLKIDLQILYITPGKQIKKDIFQDIQDTRLIINTLKAKVNNIYIRSK